MQERQQTQSVLQHENQYWPVALEIAYGQPTLQQHMQALKFWDAWFARAEPFHVVRVFLDAASIRHPKGAAQATKGWMKAGAAARISCLVQSMLIVAPADQFAHMRKMSVQKAFGIPGGLFPSLDDAFAWLEELPEPVNSARVDQASINAVKQFVEMKSEMYNVQY